LEKDVRSGMLGELIVKKKSAPRKPAESTAAKRKKKKKRNLLGKTGEREKDRGKKCLSERAIHNSGMKTHSREKTYRC